MNRRLIVVGIATISAACAPDAATPEHGVSVRDSAGVRVVNIESLSELPARALSGPVTEISSARLGAAVALADGRLVVVDGLSRKLQLYEQDGTLVRELGEAEEAIMARDLWPTAAGTVVGYDRMQRRVSSHSLEGGPGAFWPVEADLPAARAIGRLDSGEIVLRNLVFDAPPTGFDTTTVAIMVLHEGASAIETLGEWKSARMGRVGSPPAQLVTSPIFEPRLAAAAGGDRIVLSDCRDPVLEVIHPADGLKQIVRWPSKVESVTEEDVRLYRQVRLEGLDMDRQRQARQLLDAKTVSLQLPVCDEIRMDPAGRTWVRLFARPAETQRRWLVFAEDGRPLFSVDIPPASRVVSIGEDRLVTIQADPSGGNLVRVYTLD